MHIRENDQNGRTLVEIIGVLALIGILTMGFFGLYHNAATRIRVNDIIDSVRKRALVSREKTSRMTYGMFNGADNSKSVTTYGYGIAPSTKFVYEGNIRINGIKHSFVKVPVGAINGGNPIPKSVCENLLGMVNTTSPVAGDIVGIYMGTKCKTQLQSCDVENDVVSPREEPESTIPVICVGIKS